MFLNLSLPPTELLCCSSSSLWHTNREHSDPDDVKSVLSLCINQTTMNYHFENILRHGCSSMPHLGLEFDLS